jgi:hypothetical protein
MLANSVSQLPVMTNERDVKGMITWQAIGSRMALGATGQYAREYMEPHHEVRFDRSIFSAIPTIIANEYVLIRANDARISGIVTSSDLSVEFRKLTEPFLLLSEIENWIRNIIRDKFTSSDIRSACDPNASRDVREVSDLTFGEYIRLLQDPARWAQLDVKIDRVIFCEKLDLVREIRNDVMHFKLNIKNEDLESLRDYTSFLKYLGIIFSPD